MIWNEVIRGRRESTYPIDNVHKGLCIALSETTDHVGRLLARQDSLYKQDEFTLGDGAANQGLQGLFTGVEDEGWSFWCLEAIFAGLSVTYVMSGYSQRFPNRKIQTCPMSSRRSTGSVVHRDKRQRTVKADVEVPAVADCRVHCSFSLTTRTSSSSGSP